MAAARLVPSVDTYGFGAEVAVSGDTVVVGSPGAVHVFVRQGVDWVEQAMLTGEPVPEGSEQFGRAIDIAMDTLVVGASNEERAYVFVRNDGSWTSQGHLRPHVPSDNAELFGSAVAIDGDTIRRGRARLS